MPIFAQIGKNLRHHNQNSDPYFILIFVRIFQAIFINLKYSWIFQTLFGFFE